MGKLPFKFQTIVASESSNARMRVRLRLHVRRACLRTIWQLQRPAQHQTPSLLLAV